MLDTRSLVSALCLILVIGILLHFVNWRIHRRYAGTKYWTIGLSTQTLGIFLSIGFNGTAATDPVFLLLMNLLFSTGQVLMLYGTARFSDHPYRFRVYAALLGVMLAGYAWFGLVNPHVMGRIITLAVVLISTNALGLSRLWFVYRRDGPAGVVVLASAQAATIIVSSALIVLQLAGGSEVANVYDSNPLLPIAVLTLIAFETTTIFGYLLLSAGHSQAQLRQLALSDPLTGLANRRGFERELARRIGSARREDQAICLTVFDVDRFKRINDTHGHDAGDLVLRHVSEVAASCLRDRDMLARIGGEEFAVIAAPGTASSGELEALASRIRAAVESSPARLGDTVVPVTISLGCAHADCRDATDIERLFKAADTALYAAKSGGRNRVEMAA